MTEAYDVETYLQCTMYFHCATYCYIHFTFYTYEAHVFSVYF